MGSISRISTQIVADARQFNAVTDGVEKKSQSIFSRLSQMKFSPPKIDDMVGPRTPKQQRAADKANAPGDSYAAFRAGIVRTVAAAMRLRDTLKMVARLGIAPVPVRRDPMGNVMPRSMADMYERYRRPVYITFRVVTAPVVAGMAVIKRALGGVRSAIGGVSSALSGFRLPYMFGPLAVLGALGVSAYGFIEFSRAMIDANVETYKFATSAGTAVAGVDALGREFRYMGAEAGGAIKALKALESLQLDSTTKHFATNDMLGRLEAQSRPYMGAYQPPEPRMAMTGGLGSPVAGLGVPTVQDYVQPGKDAVRYIRTGQDLVGTYNKVADALRNVETAHKAVALASHLFGANADNVLIHIMRNRAQRAEANKSANGDRLMPDGGRSGGDGFLNAEKAIEGIRVAEVAAGRLRLAVDGVFTKFIEVGTPYALVAIEAIRTGLERLNSTTWASGLTTVVSTIAAGVLSLPASFKVLWQYMLWGMAEVDLQFKRWQMDAKNTVADILDAMTIGPTTKKVAALRVDTSDMKAALDENPKAGEKRYQAVFDKQDAVNAIAALGKEFWSVDDIVKRLNATMAQSKMSLRGFDGTDLLLGIKRQYGALIDEMPKIAVEVEHPFEKLQNTLAKLDIMKTTLGMSTQVFGRATMKAFSDLESALPLMDIRLPTLARKDSSEAVGAINRSEIEYRVKVADTPEKRQARLMEQANVLLELIKAAAERSANAAENRRMVALPVI